MESSASFGRGGKLGESVDFFGVDLEAPSLGGFLPGVPEAALPVSLEVFDEAGLLPVFVGVSGAFPDLPAAGEGIVLL